MPEVAESIWSRETRLSNSPGSTLEFFVFGAGDELAAEEALRAHLAAAGLLTYRGLGIQSVRIRCAGQRSDGRWYTCDVEYGIGQVFAPGGGGSRPRFSVRFGGQQINQLHFIGPHQSFTQTGVTAVDFGGAINLTHEGVAGAEIPRPMFQFALSIEIPTSQWTEAYQAQIARIAYTTNDRPWRSFARGEVLFEGLDGAGELGENTSLTFGFGVSPHAENLTVGEITGIKKPGWHYLWVFYRHEVDDSGKQLRPHPAQVDVGPVYYESDFRQLGLGG